MLNQTLFIQPSFFLTLHTRKYTHKKSLVKQIKTTKIQTFIIKGTILGATEMVTGFPPSNLLMTSA